MSKMELRSSRSRSKTPFLTQDLIDREVAAGVVNNHIETTVVRTTRRTVFKTNENASSSTDEINTSKESNVQAKSSQRRSQSRSEKSLRNRILKTSDYSSEDGENEVTSTKTVKQNEKNQLVEHARTLVNGSEMPAFELYKKSGRYWDVYPKTDWTYSQHSKDRVEIAPGVVAMPNMSRKTIHSLDESSQSYNSDTSHSLYSENVSHKNINTDDLFTAKYSTSLSEGVKRNLFNNNGEDYYIKRRGYSRWTSFKETIVNYFTYIYTIYSYFYLMQTTVFSLIHRVASKVMLWDTYLMWKTRPGNKAAKLALLCLIPLLILAGFWFFSSLGSALYGALGNITYTSFVPTLTIWNEKAVTSSNKENKASMENLVDLTLEETFSSKSEQEKRFKRDENFNADQNFERNYPNPPKASEIASSLTTDQLETIALIIKKNLESDKEIKSGYAEEIVESPHFQSLINKYFIENIQYINTAQEGTKEDNGNTKTEENFKKHELLIAKLLDELHNIKQDILLNYQANSDYYSKLSLDMKKCCSKRYTINIEGYVSKVVTDLLNNKEFLENQKGLNDWLRSLFVAKQYLEDRLGNITANVDEKIASIVESNSQTILNHVTSKMVELNSKHTTVKNTEVVGGISEDEIKKVVKGVLAIYDADRTGLVDYAMESMGGQIVTTRCTELYHYGKAVVSILGVPLWYPSNSPRTAIRPGMAPGECWAFQNFPGFVVIKLSARVRLEAFSLEHISRLLVPEGKIDSAPKEFEVYGLVQENDREPVLLGTYTYDYDGEPLQFFPIQTPGLQVFDMIELRIVSNHGNPNYTCLYRFRVHGRLHHEENR